MKAAVIRRLKKRYFAIAATFGRARHRAQSAHLCEVGEWTTLCGRTLGDGWEWTDPIEYLSDDQIAVEYCRACTKIALPKPMPPETPAATKPKARKLSPTQQAIVDGMKRVYVPGRTESAFGWYTSERVMQILVDAGHLRRLSGPYERKGVYELIDPRNPVRQNA